MIFSKKQESIKLNYDNFESNKLILINDEKKIIIRSDYVSSLIYNGKEYFVEEIYIHHLSEHSVLFKNY